MTHPPHTISDSDSECVTEHVQPSILADNEDVGFRNDWVHTVENEVTRGKLLRTEKPSTSRQKREYDVINIKLSKPYRNENNKRRRTDCSKKHKGGLNPCLTRSKTSPKCNSNAQVLKEFNHRAKIKRRKRCPMRLAELAVPTKRHCIETWRNKSYLLPDFMIERLKQHVMDQRPIVQIPEAIYCFRKRKSPSSKKSFKKEYCKCKTLHKPLRMMEAQTLCASFGQKIAESLRAPLNLSLGSNLHKISHIVAMDMAHIMYGRKNGNKENVINNSIHVEMANKVTIWILNILEDASYNLLLEDIKDLEEEEGPVLDFIDDLVANVVTICEPCTLQDESSSESSYKDEYNVTEEQYEMNRTPDTKSDIREIDDSELTDAEYFKKAITNIVHNFEKVMEDEQDNENIDEINDRLDDIRDTYENENINEINEQLDDDRGSYQNENIDDLNEHLDDNRDAFENENINEINEQLDDNRGTYENENINEINEQLDDNRGSYENENINEQLDDNRGTYENENIEEINEQLDDNRGSYENENIDEINEQLDANTNEAIQKQNEIEIEDNVGFNNTDNEQVNTDFENPEQNDLNIVENVDATEENDSNVSDDDDDMNKKVKFSLIDIVNQDESKLLADISHKLSEKINNHEREQELWKPYVVGDHKSNIVFAEPNQNLLSDADELWPSDLSSPSLKASASVSKSITSLGNIIETDERNVTPPENEDKVEVTSEIGDQISEKIRVENDVNKFEDFVPSLIEMIGDIDLVLGDTNENEVIMQMPNESHITNEAKIKSIESPQIVIDTKQSDEQLDEKSQVIEDKNNTDAKDIRDKFYFEAGNFGSKYKNMEEIIYNIIDEMPIVAPNKLIKDEKTEVAFEPIEDSAWKVQPESVPSWVVHSRGEPYEDPMPNPTTTIRDCDIHDWCKHLEGGFKELESWTEWVDKIYQDMNYLKYTKEFCARCSCAKRKQTTKWTKLIKHVKRDTVLWRNVFRSSQEKCKIFRRFYCDRLEVAPTTCCTCKCACKNR